MPGIRVRRLAAAAAVVALVAGCGSSPPPVQSPPGPSWPAASGSATPSAPASPTASPSPRATPAPVVLLRRGDSGRDVRELQARLAQIGWFDHGVTGYFGPITDQAVAGFQAKRELPVTGMVDLSTWSRLLGMTREPTHGEIYPATVPRPSTAALDPRCETGRAMCIDKTERRLHWVVDGAVRLSFDVRFGSEYTPTREGQFAVYAKDRDHVSQLYGSSMPFSMFFSGGQAVHFSYDFAAKGYSGASHGCINTRDWDLTERLYDDVRIGDAVVIYWS